jgi:dynactin 1
VISPQKSDDEILSPQPRSPVRSRTAALEKLTSAPSSATRAPAPAGPSTRPSAANAAANREIEDLKAKLRVIERKRAEDREKLKQLDKLQGERNRFEGIIQKLQTKYQPQQQENNDLKRMLKEAESRLESIESMQAEHESALELATLDREMAEETAEVHKAEFEAARLRVQELELELEILQADNEELEKGMSPEEKTNAGWIQMEREKDRLREALIRLRDITRDQEAELKDQIKGLEDDLLEYGEVREQFELAKEKLGQSESAVEDLRQQLDNALGAEDMIEELTERNMSQAEQLDELKAVIDDLENLKEINDELEVNHVQNEKEMQEEIDFKEAVITEQARRAAQQEEQLEDMEYTLSRFRELVTSLQTDLEDMRASHAVTENESEQLNSKSRAMMDLNMKLQISAAKAQVKTIDLELRRMEAQEAEQHLGIVKLFLPDTYQADRDSVLALLRFKRLAFKANLLNGFIKERVNGQPHAGHEDDIIAGCDAVDKLTWVSSMCDRFVNTISHCSMEQFAKFEGALYELEPVERALNQWIDGLRRDELKEQQCASELQRTIAVMTHLGELHIPSSLGNFADEVHMKTSLVQSHLESAATTLHTMRGMVQRVIPPAGEDDDQAQYFARRAETAIAQTRNSKVIAGKAVRALEEMKARSLSLPPENLDAFEQCEALSLEVVELARKIALDLHQFLHEEGRADPYTYVEVHTVAQKTAQTASATTETDLFGAYLAKLRILTGQIGDLAALAGDLSQTQEFDRPQAPWLLRSQELKRLQTIPVDAEEELRRLKDDFAEARRAVAVRDESLGTAQLKIETLEARMRDASTKASRISDLEGQLEAQRGVVHALKEDIERGDRELKALEAERDRWKKIAGDSRVLADDAAGTKAGKERAVATAREMDALRAEIAALQAAVRYLREDSRRARVTEQARHEWLAEPLGARALVPAEQRRALVQAEGRDALGELLRMAGAATVFDLASLPPDRLAWRPARATAQFHAARQEEDLAAWNSWRESVSRKAGAVLGRPVGGGTNRKHRKEMERASLTWGVRLPEDAVGGKMAAAGMGNGELKVKIVGSP